MKLSEYLSANNLSLREFSKRSNLGVATVHRASNGTGIASRRTLKAIIAATNGEVGIADLICLEDDGCEADAT